MSTDIWNQLKHFNSVQINFLKKSIPRNAIVIYFDMFLKLIWAMTD